MTTFQKKIFLFVLTAAADDIFDTADAESRFFCNFV